MSENINKEMKGNSVNVTEYKGALVADPNKIESKDDVLWKPRPTGEFNDTFLHNTPEFDLANLYPTSFITMTPYEEAEEGKKISNILNSITEYLCDLLKLKRPKIKFLITIVKFNVWFQFTKRKKKSKPKYKICISEYSERQIENDELLKISGYDILIQALDIEDINLARYIMIYLHEFGHMQDYQNHSKNINKYYKRNQKEKDKILKNKYPNIIEAQKDYVQCKVEVIADRFAFQYAPVVFKYLKEKGLIK